MSDTKRLSTLMTVIGFGLLSPLSVFAHAHLVKAMPAKDAVVHQMPDKVTLQFSEDLETSMCKLQLKDVNSGEMINTGKLTDGGQGANTLQIFIEPKKAEKSVNSKYQVIWKAVSKDTHRMKGDYEFSVKVE